MGMLSGKLADKFNQYTLATLSTLISELALILSLLGYFLSNYVLCFFIGAAWGFADCIFNNLVSVICSHDYEGKIEIFAVFRFNLAFFAAITFGINIALGD